VFSYCPSWVHRCANGYVIGLFWLCIRSLLTLTPPGYTVIVPMGDAVQVWRHLAQPAPKMASGCVPRLLGSRDWEVLRVLYMCVCMYACMHVCM
jgi:hypothetical protein